MIKKAVVVALSGGVDSTVAAWLLAKKRKEDIESGLEPEGSVFLAGAMHYIWQGSRCCDAEMILKARALCEKLDIPFFLIDMTGEFRTEVVDDFVETYIAGKTPNPCVRCNQRVRFSGFYDKVKQELAREPLPGRGAALPPETPLYLATGHYVNKREKEGRIILCKGNDPSKDQSYMLYQLPETVLPFVLFPLGGYTKQEVIAIAGDAGLLDGTVVRESQDACFVEGDYAGFIRDYTDREDLSLPGDIVDTSGNLLGRHRGYLEYTVGQRKGLSLGTGPWYVADIQPETNRIIVAREEEIRTLVFKIGETRWFAPADFFSRGPAVKSCTVKIRYRSGDIPCTVESLEGDCARVVLSEPAIVTPGQSAVFYLDSCMLGGGIIIP